MRVSTGYRELLAQYAPRPIHTEAQYRQAVGQLQELMAPNPDRDRSLMIELLSTLIEQYENRTYPTPRVSPPEMLAHLMEVHNLKAAQLAQETGIPPATLSNVLKGRRGISKANAVKLAGVFKMPADAFIGD